MTAILDIARRFTVRNGDTVLMDHGSAHSPIQTSCAGTPIHRPRTITLEPGESMQIWDYEDDGDFVAFLIECTGFAWLVQKVDAPTAADDPTPAGTAVNYPKDGISCVAPRIIEGMIVPVVASSSNYAGSAFHASTANGRRYEIWVKNPSATDDIDVTFCWTL